MRKTDMLKPFFTLFHSFQKLPSIISIGILVFATILITSLSLFFESRSSVSSSSHSFTTLFKNKELPIYCVDTPKKEIALSFDAAWGKRSQM